MSEEKYNHSLAVSGKAAAASQGGTDLPRWEIKCALAALTSPIAWLRFTGPLPSGIAHARNLPPLSCILICARPPQLAVALAYVFDVL